MLNNLYALLRFSVRCNNGRVGLHMHPISWHSIKHNILADVEIFSGNSDQIYPGRWHCWMFARMEVLWSCSAFGRSPIRNVSATYVQFKLDSNSMIWFAHCRFWCYVGAQELWPKRKIILEKWHELRSKWSQIKSWRKLNHFHETCEKWTIPYLFLLNEL